MQRVTVSLDSAVAPMFDDLVRQQGYRSRSEAMRDLVREAVDARRLASNAGTQCIANLSYIYDHRTRVVADRLLDLQHAHHDLVVATTHVILDHVSSLESMILKGPTVAVRALADAIRAERGVRFGAVNLISIEPNDDHREPGAHHHPHTLAHASPPRG